MNDWYTENKYHIDMFFNNVKNFITYNHISLNITIEELYNNFIAVAYKGSISYDKQYSVKKYKINKKWHNEYYEFTLGNDLFDLIHDTTVYIQECNRNFLDNIYVYSIQNFFEQYFQNNYNIYTDHVDNNEEESVF